MEWEYQWKHAKCIDDEIFEGATTAKQRVEVEVKAKKSPLISQLYINTHIMTLLKMDKLVLY